MVGGVLRLHSYSGCSAGLDTSLRMATRGGSTVTLSMRDVKLNCPLHDKTHSIPEKNNDRNPNWHT